MEKQEDEIKIRNENKNIKQELWHWNPSIASEHDYGMLGILWMAIDCHSNVSLLTDLQHCGSFFLDV